MFGSDRDRRHLSVMPGAQLGLVKAGLWMPLVILMGLSAPPPRMVVTFVVSVRPADRALMLDSAIVIELPAIGHYLVNGQLVTAEQLQPRLTAIRTSYQNAHQQLLSWRAQPRYPLVSIRSAPERRYLEFIGAVDASRGAGLKVVYYDQE